MVNEAHTSRNTFVEGERAKRRKSQAGGKPKGDSARGRNGKGGEKAIIPSYRLQAKDINFKQKPAHEND